MVEDKYKLFHKLYKSGVRFIPESEHNSLSHGIYRASNSGKVEGYTIKGMKKSVKLNVDDAILTSDEIEMLFNIIAFERSINSK